MLAFAATVSSCLVDSASALGMLFVPDIPSKRLELRSLHVEATIKEQVCRTKSEFVFHNPTGRVLEGRFVFPIPRGASISNFALYIDGRRVEGQLMEAGKARRIYEDIVRRMKDPALLEHLGEGLFEARIYPIPPRGDRKIDITYDMVLKADSGVCVFRYPLKAPVGSGARCGELVMQMDIRSQRPIKSVYSPTHEFDVVRESDHHVRASLEKNDVLLDRDVEFVFTMDEKEFGCSILAYRPDPAKDGYFMMLITPSARPAGEEIVPKDVVFLLDVSGSMSGQKIRQARKALKFCVRSLYPKDRFDVVAFSTAVRPMARRLEEVSAATVEKACRFIDDLRAGGATNMEEALRAALDELMAAGKASDRSRMVVLITDGKPTVGETSPRRIKTDVETRGRKADAKLFCIGIGYAVNTKLLDSISGALGGFSSYFSPNASMEEKLSSFYRKISSPVLTDIRIDFGPIETYDLYPHPVPDLFAGSQIELYGRYRGSGDVALTLSGRSGKGKVKLIYDASFPAGESANDFVARIWAQRKIGYLLDQIRLHGENEEVKNEIVELAKRFSIETPYTSFLVTDDSEAAPAPPHPIFRVRAPQPPFMPGVMGFRRENRRRKMSHPEYEGTMKGAGGSAAPGASLDLASDSGARAVYTARKLAKLKRASVVESSPAETRKKVGPKTFVLREGRWTDEELLGEGKSGSRRVTRIRTYSPAYFRVAGCSEFLSRCLSLGERVIMLLPDGTVLETSPDEGEEVLDDGTISRIREAAASLERH